ncbi:MAG TPA: ribosome biogenesis GTP-binding protein YihA/YsxC [Candidatus Kapabacteria bacterium]|nr:ribosome biogenesis GTP-binding protein YihA/YsxC [Candidatus Kapabacteria bacterium]
MKQLNAEFVKSAAKYEQFPNLNLPEVAFSGRSNVGKSSLINSIILRRNLALVSSTPGKTKLINFFSVENKWTCADLPGFGFASVSKEQREVWRKLNFEYLEKRQNLKLICALVDSRHDPTDTDLALIEWYEHNDKKFLIILTKVDKINKKLLEERTKQLKTLVSECKNAVDVIAYSAKTNQGRDELLAIIKKNIN